ncbi:MAG: alpha/beta fold hydrolase [Elusimicrobia bacterium]|nr:alpha/beta fold hydrolase [Elusimicrobiota bacterium]
MSDGSTQSGIAYSDEGSREAKAVVLIHGFPFNREMWRPQVDALKGRWRAVAYDVRGHGKSSVGDGQYMVETFVDDLIELLDHLGIERAVLCGLSMGGYIALRAAERQPERVSGLVLCDTKSEADDNAAKLKRASALRSVKTGGTAAFITATLPNLFAKRNLDQKHPAVAAVQGMMDASEPLGVRGALLALASRMDTTASLEKIAVPSLLLVGAEDAVTPPAVMRAMASRIRGSKLHVIPDAGHVSGLENPVEFNRRLVEFLDGLG